MPEKLFHTRAGRLSAFREPELAYRAGQWAKAALLADIKAEAWCARNDLALTRAHGESLNTSGGFLVPQEIASAVISQRETYGALRATAQVVSMRSDSITIPRRGTAVSATFLGEGVAASEQQVSVDNITLVASKLAVLIRASSELDEDSVVDLGQFLVDELAYAFALKEDQTGFNGDGTQSYAGMRGVTNLLLDGNHNAGKVAAASGHNTFATIDVADLGNLIAKLPSNALRGARWLVSQYGYGATFCRLAASAGGIVVQPDINGRLVPHFMGFPVQITQALPNVGTTLTGSVMLLFGDASLAIALGDRRTINLRASPSRYVEYDQIGFLGTERIDIVAHNLGDNTNPGPMVGLVGTA